MFRTRAAAATIACLLLIFCFVPAASAHAEAAKIQTGQTGTITDECTITMPEELSGKEYRITDGLVESYQSFTKGQTITVGLPEGAQGLYLEWYDATSQYTVSQLGAGGAVLAEEAASPFINAYYPLEAGASSVVVTLLGKASLSTLAVYGEGDLPAGVQQWREAGSADLFVVASTSLTALDEFFGVIATYACNHDIPTTLVVMSRYSRSAQQELLAALWYAGYDTYPIFGDFYCENNSLYNMVRSDWGRKTTLTFLEDHIARLAPKVVVSHMDDETAPDGAAQFTGEYAIRAAEDSGVQKLYLASGSGTTTLDFNTPLNGCGGRTALELAADAFALCTTRHAIESELIPTSSFLLEYSDVGDDSAGNDLFEHIDTASLGGYVDPTPTPTPTPAPTPEPTEAPAAEAAAQPEATNAPAASNAGPAVSLPSSPAVLIGLPAAGLVLSIILLLAFGLRRRRGQVRGGAVALSLLPLVLGVLASGALYLISRTSAEPETAAETPAPTAELTPTPTQEPTPEPTQEPAEEEEIAASASDEYYRGADDPAEVIVVDEETGHWEYRSDTLSILIDRVETEYTNYGGKTYPLVYFVAHIRMRDVDSFRTVQAADNRNGAGAIKPWILARRNKAVLMITGDNLVESDSQYKSILIREGKVFLDSAKCDTLAMYPDMTMRIYSPKETNASELLMDGVRDAFSFGPTLLRDGEITEENIDHVRRIGNETNPRTGIGMIEPGHFVAIVVDGRQKEYSYGMRLSAFCELFIKEGCTEAYNLDGGVSACMLFMGEQLNRHGNKHVGTVEDTYQRRIPDGLVWGYSGQVPSEDDPIYNRGEG
ncbi:MAG: phosphodiester glycosidase family protein [Clostridiales bacterium]|nr:phosphodiester glycosidase family protein [Clostridiales bacterium]